MLELYYCDAERKKGDHPARGMRNALYDQAGAHRARRSVHAGVSEDSPNNRMPALVDTKPKGGDEPVAIFESGAIMMYVAEKLGKFYPQETSKNTT